MAGKKSVHELLEKSALPIVVIILIPVGFVAYALYANNFSATPPVPTASQQTQPQVSPATQAAVQATIALNDPSGLPQSVAAAQLVPFSFTITNTGNMSGTVPYKVYVKWSTGEQDVIDENIATLQGSASTVVNEQLKFEIATETAAVYLELTQTGQTVQFALPRKQ